MRWNILALTVGLVVVFAGHADAAPTAGDLAASRDVVATVHQFMDGFGNGDWKTAIAACDSPSSVVEDIAPHVWQGPTGCADFVNAYKALVKADKISEGTVTLGRPWRLSVDAGTAYVVCPATFSYRARGKSITEPRAIFTAALRKTAAGWRITAWTWSASR